MMELWREFGLPWPIEPPRKARRKQMRLENELLSENIEDERKLPMPDLTKETAEALAAIIVPAVRDHAKKFLDSLGEEDKKEMDKHSPQTFAVLTTLSTIQGTFCEIEPKINQAIDSLGWIAKMFLGSAYAMLLVFQTVVQQIAVVLCGVAPVVPAKPTLDTNVSQKARP